MLSNYIKIALRNIIRHKLHSFINIMGLSIGMACAILLFLFVRDELSYDKHHSKHDRIYMVKTYFRFGDRELWDYGSYFPTGPTLRDEYPAIEESVRFYSADRIYFIDQSEEIIGEDNIRYVDPEIFRVFDHKFIYGSPEGALDAPKTIALSKSLSHKYFGDQNPVGKTLSRNNGIDYTVTGVFEDIPHNSFLEYDALLPMVDLAEVLGAERINSRNSCSFYASTGRHLTFILLKESARIESITDDFERFRDKYLIECGRSLDGEFKPVFQLLSDVYLYYKPMENLPPLVLLRLSLLSSLALVILIIVCINYMNLTTAGFTGRAREVGVRKVLGAYRSSLIIQFLSESIIITAIGLLLSLILIELFLPTFNNLAHKEITFSIIAKPGVFSGLFIITLAVGIVAGSYPAFFLSSFLPVKVIKGDIQSVKGKGLFRKVLVVVQFVVSIVVIVVTMATREQARFIRNMDLGFNKDNIVTINPRDPDVIKSISAFKKEILGNNEILAVSRSLAPIGLGTWNTVVKIEDSKGGLIDKHLSFTQVDYDYIEMMGIEVLLGRSFSRDMGMDPKEAFLVNEILIKEMGWTDSPIGKRILSGTRNGKVIGVLKDFHFHSAYQKLRPMIITLGERDEIEELPVTYIKVSSSNSKETIEFMKDKWAELNPMYPFEYTFLEDTIKDMYEQEEDVYKILDYSAFLSIFVSCLGLFGLSSFIAEKKTKEIGIRKAHGASIWNILYHLIFDYIKLIIISSFIAWPLLKFLDMTPDIYAYNPEPNPWLIIYTVCFVFAIALVTISYHTIKAALTDPVKALRYE